jgi:hypothetical protein
MQNPLYGDLGASSFGATGYAVCYRGIAPDRPEERRIGVTAPWRDHWQAFGISDGPPEGFSNRHFSFQGFPRQYLELILPTQQYMSPVVHAAISGPAIGEVSHVMGRGGEDYIGRGSTSQHLVNIDLTIEVTKDGMCFDFTGELRGSGFLGDDVVPELRQDGYIVRCRLTWEVARFLFNHNTMMCLYSKFVTEGG